MIQLGAFLTAVKAGLAARPGLANVTVRLVAGDESTADSIVLYAPAIQVADATSEYDRDWGGDPRIVTVNVAGIVRTYRSSRDGDTAAAAALDAADTVMDEVHTYLATDRPTLGSQTTEALVANMDYGLAVSDTRGWVVTVTFTMRFTALDNPTD